MTIVDAHHHLWDPETGGYPWMTGPYEALRRPYTITDLEPHLAANQVAATVVVQARADFAETADLLRAAESHPAIAGVVGWLDLTAWNLPDMIALLRSMPGGDRLVGLRHDATSELDPRWLLHGAVDANMACLAEHGLTYDFEITTREIDAAAQLAARHPETRFVLDHVAKPPIATGWSAEWADGLRRLATSPNVWCKISGLVTEANWTDWSVEHIIPVVRHAVTVFGGHRLVFGTDWPVCELAATYEQVIAAARDCLAAAALEPDEIDAVMHRNALTCYRLTASRSLR